MKIRWLLGFAVLAGVVAVLVGAHVVLEARDRLAALLDSNLEDDVVGWEE